jgi:cell division protein FtsB
MVRTRCIFAFLREVAMDEREAEYLRQQIRELERAKNRWKAATVALLAAFALFLVLGTGSVLTYSLFSVRTEALRARDAEMMAREQAEMAEIRARQAEMQAQQALEEVATSKNAKPKTRADGGKKQDSKR